MTPRQFELHLERPDTNGLLRERLAAVECELARNDLTPGERLDLHHQRERFRALLHPVIRKGEDDE